jgi:predicted AAA+ superfamily ATPase
MSYLARALAPRLTQAARQFPVIILTGPRRAGKTTLLRACFPHAAYYLLEDPDILGRVKSDPRAFLEEVRTPAIVDEIQNAPELFRYIRSEVDQRPRRYGQWLLTGSQEMGLMKGVTESMAGRAALFELLPLALEETPKVSLFRGGFPEVLLKPAAAETWFRSYLQTYLERDIRSLSAIRDLTTFRRFLALLASRIGQMLNYTELATPLGVSVPTISAWLGFLDITRQIILVPPFFENFGKRLTKAPKLYFTDTGLACYLLGLESAAMLRRSPFLGPLFESFVASELLKMQVNRGKRRELYYFRDRQGLEVDFLVSLGNRRVVLLEAKASQTLHPRMAASMQRLKRAMPAYRTKSFVVHLPSKKPPMLHSLAESVSALTISELPTVFQQW